MSKPTFLCKWQTLIEISEVWAEKVTGTVSVICLERTWIFVYVSQRKKVSCPTQHLFQFSEEFSSADNTSTALVSAYYCCVEMAWGWCPQHERTVPYKSVTIQCWGFLITYVKSVNGWAALCFPGMCII